MDQEEGEGGGRGGNNIMGEVDTCDASYASIEEAGEKEVGGGKWEEERGGWWGGSGGEGEEQ